VDWLALEKDLQNAIDKSFPGPKPPNFEIHATEISNPRNGYFKAISIAQRLAFRDEWFRIAQKHGLKFTCRAIEKKRFLKWSVDKFGNAVALNPHVAAFPLLARVVDDLLKKLPGSPLGIFISDQNHEVAHDVEKAIRLLRGTEGVLKLSQIIEKGFFIDSKKSLVLQLCDVCVYTARRREEKSHGFYIKPLDESGIPGLEPISYVGDEHMPDVLQWLEMQQKKGRPSI
jgi:hypothetical protein